jgi:diguanylate cyclase (GGDEF)-like protein/PAS domain S-box-containing protein
LEAELAVSALLTERQALILENRFLSERIDALMNVHHAAILVIDPQTGQVIDGNQTAIARYAQNRDHLLSKHISEINTLSKSEIAARMRQALAAARDHFEFRHRLLDGSVQEVDVYSGPILYNGRPALISFIHDATRRKATERKLRTMATTDSLTGCCNRRHFLSILRREFQIARRNSTPLTFAMMDLDLFKRVNDTFGHSAGDGLLRAIAATCRKGIRESDTLGRLGGEEFGFILPVTDTQDAFHVLSRIHEEAGKTRVKTSSGPIGVTVSIGISSQADGDKDEQALISRADAALYAAKAAGRNRIESSHA